MIRRTNFRNANRSGIYDSNCGETRDYALSLLETNKNIKKTKPQEELIDIDDMF